MAGSYTWNVIPTVVPPVTPGSSSASWIGIGLFLQSVTPLNNNTVLRVRFSNDPKQVSSVGVNDALNVFNYTLTGPGFVGFQFATTVSGDPQSIDLTLTSQLTAGLWTLTASTNIQTASGSPLVSPTSLQFTITDIVNTTIINPGSSNDDCESILRKHLNPALAGPGWNALIAAFAAGDCPNFENAKLAANQFFKISANGIYLDRITANDGITRPKNVGISDDIYRRLAISINSNKVVQEALLEVLAIFYGEDAVRAHATTEGFEPFALQNNDDLNIIVDGLTRVKVNFLTSEFQLISAAKANEVAAAITRACIISKSNAFAFSFTDPLDGKNKVKIYSGGLGLKGSIQIKGTDGVGKAQNVLQFQTGLNDLVYTGTV